MTGSIETTKVLSVGIIVGGQTSANRGWVDGLRQLTRDVAEHRLGVASGINVNIEFHVPGNHLTPEFDGVRTGYFRKADSLLKVQAALPAEAPENPRPVLIQYLGAALDAVDAWAIAKQWSVDTTALRGIVAAVEVSDG